MSRALGISLPAPLRHFFSLFPLYTHPPINSPDKARPLTCPTLWIHVPWSPDADVLSSDVECLKWQAYLALRAASPSPFAAYCAFPGYAILSSSPEIRSLT